MNVFLQLMLKYLNYLHGHISQCCNKHKHDHHETKWRRLENHVKVTIDAGTVGVDDLHESNKEASKCRHAFRKLEDKSQLNSSKTRNEIDVTLEGIRKLLHTYEDIDSISDADEDL